MGLATRIGAGGLVAVASTLISGAVLAISGVTLAGTAMIVSPGDNSAHSLQMSSDASGTFGAAGFAVPSGLTVAGLNTLSTDFQALTGDCAGGAPRFSVTVMTPSGPANLFYYLGTPPNFNNCPTSWASSGNLVDAARTIDSSQLGGGTFYDSLAHVQSAYGSYPVTDVSLVLDAGWAGTQVFQFDNVAVNATVYTFEPTKDDCKDGGWQALGFRNQGQCVSSLVSQRGGNH